MTEQLRETTRLSAVELYDIPTGRHAREMGKRAMFGGFVPIEMAVSPHEEMRREMKESVVEQDQAIDAVIEALDRSEVRLPYDNRPIANIAFLGPTGVGKSEVAKTLSELVDDGEGTLIKIDCSDYSQGHEVLRLVGAPPSYVGREQEPVFAKDKVENGKVVVLFDEVEKGSSRLYNLMLQIMGDGKLQLNNGDVVSFREAVIILTSNLGAKEMSAELSPISLGFGSKKQASDRVKLESVASKSFIDFFAPEFINRLNSIVVFHPLSGEGLGRVLDVKLEELNREYRDTFGAVITLTDRTREHLVATAQQQPHLGARPLVRALEDEIQTAFGRYTGAGHIQEGTHVRVFHREELPEEYQPNGNNPLIFTAKQDKNIKKYRPPLEITSSSHPAFVPAEFPTVVPKTEEE